MKKLVGIIMGSKSDYEVMLETAKLLKQFEIGYDINISSAHRSPDVVAAYSKGADKVYEVIIAGAGMAAHLPGVIAANTTIPVIGVPMKTTALAGADSLYSMVQMPTGIPVATVAIGKAGAKNAALLAVQILALKYPEIKEKLIKYRETMREEVLEADKSIQELDM